MPLRDLGRLRENEWFSKSQVDGKGDREKGLSGNPLLVLELWCYGKHSMSLPDCSNQLLPWKIRGVLLPCATAQSEQSVCNLCNAKSFLFAPLLLFPHFSHCSLTVTFLCNCASSYPKSAGAKFGTPLSNVLSSSQLCTPGSGPQPWPLHWISHEKQLLPLCEPLFLSFSSSSPFVLWLLVYTIMLGNMSCLVAANRR